MKINEKDIWLANQQDQLLNALKRSALVSITDPEGTIIYANDTFCEATGYDEKELLGQNHRILKSDQQSPELYSELWETILKGKVWKGEMCNSKKDGTIFWTESNIIPFFDESGKIEKFVAVRFDITQRKNAESKLEKLNDRFSLQNQEYESLNLKLKDSLDRIERIKSDLEIAKTRAEESDRLKAAFLSNMSHEIRTPMNGILGFAHLMKKPDLTPDEHSSYVKIIEQSSARMLHTINDLVEISKIEAGQVALHYTLENINSVLQSVKKNFECEAKRRNLTLKLSTPLKDGNAEFETDKLKLKTIIKNLLQNAIKYSENGDIEFGYQFNNNELQFFVKDHGIGISHDKQKLIFSRFVQGDMGDSREYEGVGLGLSIAESYVKMLGGKIWVESEETKGSQFNFTLPFKKTPHPAPPSSEFLGDSRPELQIRNLKVLIAEDDDTSLSYLNLIIADISSCTLRARTGDLAVKLCKENPDIDLILMDIKMPGMNGYEATKAIRAFNEDVLIIAQTAFALSGEREEALNAGCNDHISKPIDKEKLLELLGKHLSK